MKNIIISTLTLFLFSCIGLKQINKEHNKDTFLINKIESKNNWYIVYANRHDSTYMIVSKRPEIANPKWEKIKVGNYYNLKLNSIIPVINGVKMLPMNYLDYSGISLDERTVVNINPEKGIYDIYSSTNLKGLFLMK
jgi:hypothetical protein